MVAQLQAANDALRAENRNLSMEDVDEDEEHIEMNLGLGVLEGQRVDDEDDEEEEHEDDDDELSEDETSDETSSESDMSDDAAQEILGHVKCKAQAGVDNVPKSSRTRSKFSLHEQTLVHTSARPATQNRVKNLLNYKLQKPAEYANLPAGKQTTVSSQFCILECTLFTRVPVHKRDLPL